MLTPWLGAKSSLAEVEVSQVFRDMNVFLCKPGEL